MALPASLPLATPVDPDEIDTHDEVDPDPAPPQETVVEAAFVEANIEPPVVETIVEPAVVEATIVPPVVEPREARWTYEPPEADDAPAAAEPAAEPPVEPAQATAAEDDAFPEPEERPTVHSDDEAAHATSSFDAAIEPLRNRMERSKLAPAFVRDLLVPDSVLDVGETAMRWAGMPNKHERSLTSEVFFALAEWGFLAPRADGRYRVLRAPDDAKI
jgi:hypothetical protein